MPCFFFENLPEGVTFNPNATRQFYETIAGIVGVGVGNIEIHLTNTRYTLLRYDGTTSHEHGVHVFVEWHRGRTTEQKKQVGDAVRKFLVFHHLASGLDITFRDSPSGESFYYENALVS